MGVRTLKVPKAVPGGLTQVRRHEWVTERRYFLTAFTAASASTYPAPTSHRANPGRGRAVCVSTDAIRSGVRLPPAASCISATTPTTCGVAIDVPDAQV